METFIDFIISIMSFGIVGALTASLINVFKENLTKNQTKLLVIGLSVIIGAVGAWIYKTEYADALLTVLGGAPAVYGLIMKEDDTN